MGDWSWEPNLGPLQQQYMILTLNNLSSSHHLCLMGVRRGVWRLRARAGKQEDKHEGDLPQEAMPLNHFGNQGLELCCRYVDEEITGAGRLGKGR